MGKTTKLLFPLLLAFSIISWPVYANTNTPPIPDNIEISFKDLNKKHWAYNSIKISVQKGYFKGYDDGTFKPNAPVSREEFAALLSRVSTNEPDTNAAAFSDIVGRWSEQSVKDAINKGFINQSTYVNGFKPTQAMTRIEMARWLSAGLSKANSDYRQAIQDMADTVVPVAEFYKGGLQEADNGVVALNIALGLMNGYTDGSFGPNQNTTRAEVASILLRYEEAQKKDPKSVVVLNEMREIGLTGTNVVSLGFVVRTPNSNFLEFKDFRKIYGTLNNGLGTAALNRVIVVDQFKPDHPYTKMFIGKNFQPEGELLRNKEYLVFTEVIFLPKKNKIDGGTYGLAFGNKGTINGSGFMSDSASNFKIETLPYFIKDYKEYFKDVTTKTYWTYTTAKRSPGVSLSDGVYVTYNGKTFSALPPGADWK